MLNNKGENTMSIKNDYFETINKIDSKLYEINKLIKDYDSSIITHDLLNDVLDMIEKNISLQKKYKDFKFENYSI
jgi:hypothetical protein